MRLYDSSRPSSLVQAPVPRGRRLNVATVLEGSVRKAGDRLRISAQLIDVSDGYQLWARRYDSEMADVFAIQAAHGQAMITMGAES